MRRQHDQTGRSELLTVETEVVHPDARLAAATWHSPDELLCIVGDRQRPVRQPRRVVRLRRVVADRVGAARWPRSGLALRQVAERRPGVLRAGARVEYDDPGGVLVEQIEAAGPIA